VRILELPEIRQRLLHSEVIGLMRDALMAHSRGQCETPMPMHLDIAGEQAEVHMKSSYRGGGRYFALTMWNAGSRRVTA
jgi:ornithine cyclodeaminase/alanine dehydrogenase-like protein (mu-crystallin family)